MIWPMENINIGHILQYDDKISGQSLAESVSAVLETMPRLQQIPCQIHCPFSLCREMRFTYLNAHAKVKNLIFDDDFPGN